MNPVLQRIFESVPEEQPRSRLEPYRELILRWRNQGRSYRRIRKLLGDQCSMKVGLATLHEFVQRRSRPRKAQPDTETHPANNTPAPDTGGTKQAGKEYSKLSLEEATRQRALIQALRDKPVVVPEVRKRFVYDPDEPLNIERTIKEKHS